MRFSYTRDDLDRSRHKLASHVREMRAIALFRLHQTVRERDLFSSMPARAIADGDLKAIRNIRTGGHFDRTREASILDAPQQDVQRAIDILIEDGALLMDLIKYARPRKPGIGPRELRCFFAGKQANRWERFKDKPGLLLVRFEQWKFRDKNR